MESDRSPGGLQPWSALLRGLAAILALLACGAAAAQGSWTTLGPAGGTVTALLASPNSSATLYAATPQNGVFVSTDGGGSWHVANTGLPQAAVGRQMVIAVSALASDSQYVYAATSSGVYYATDAPSPQWSALPATGSASPISTLLHDPSTGLLVAAAAVGDGASVPGVYIARSVHAAGAPDAWTFVPLPATTAGRAVGGIATTPPGVQAGAGPAALMVGAGPNLFSAALSATTPHVANWVDADPTATLGGGTISTLAYSVDFQLAYACSGGTLFYSGNALDPRPTWSLAMLPINDMAGLVCAGIASVPVAVGGAPQLVLGTDQGALVSVDGTVFSATGPLGLGPSAFGFAVAPMPGTSTNALFAASGFGVVFAPLPLLQPGAAWSPSSGAAPAAGSSTPARIDNANVVDTATLGTTLYAAAADTGYVEVLATTDGGLTWTATGIGGALASGDLVNALLADSANNVLYAATSSGLLAFAPATGAWSRVGATQINGRASALALGSSAVFVGTDDGLVVLPRSANPASAAPAAAGMAGTSVRSLILQGGLVLAACIDATDANFVYFTSEADAAAGKAAWQMFGIASTGTDRITSMLLLGGNLLVATNGSLVLYGSAGSGWSSANTSADAGQQIADPFGAVNSLYTDGITIYAATGSQGVFASPVLGNVFSWTALDGTAPTALPSMEIHALRASGTTLYASTRGGVASLALPVAASAPVSSPSAAGGSAGGAFSTWLGALLALAYGLLTPRRSWR